MSIRPLDLQVAVPKMSELDRVHKTAEQPQYAEIFANEVKQTLQRQERAVQRSDDIKDGRIGKQKDETGQQAKSGHKESRSREKKSRNDDSPVIDSSRGSKLDIRI